MITLERLAETALIGLAAWFAVIAIGVVCFIGIAVWQDRHAPLPPRDP